MQAYRSSKQSKVAEASKQVKLYWEYVSNRKGLGIIEYFKCRGAGTRAAAFVRRGKEVK